MGNGQTDKFLDTICRGMWIFLSVKFAPSLLASLAGGLQQVQVSRMFLHNRLLKTLKLSKKQIYLQSYNQSVFTSEEDIHVGNEIVVGDEKQAKYKEWRIL